MIRFDSITAYTKGHSELVEESKNCLKIAKAIDFKSLDLWTKLKNKYNFLSLVWDERKRPVRSPARRGLGCGEGVPRIKRSEANHDIRLPLKYSGQAFAGLRVTISWLMVLCYLLLPSCSPPPSAVAQNNTSPNIILLMGDDHGWEETGYNGHPFLQTPVLDEMAANGLRLDRFYAAASTCSPTRGSVITGRHPNRYGTFTPNWSIRPEEISIAKLLKDQGYATAHFGKWHVGPVKAESPTSPGAMGFDEWLSHDNFFEMDPVLSRNGADPEKIEGESSEILVAETAKFIDRSKSQGKPFFIVLWFGSPHEPYSGLEKDLALYNDLPERYAQDSVGLTSNETGKRVMRSLKDVLRERYAEITAMDRAIGQLRNHLGENGLKQNTMLWYCGDNGIPSSGYRESQYRGLKGRIYEGGTIVPGIIEWPAMISTPQSSSVPTVTSDILPTLCAITGTSIPKRPLDGINLLPLLQGNMAERPSPIYFWQYDTQHELANKGRPYIKPRLQQGTTPLVKMMNGIYTRTFRNFHHPKIVEEDFIGPRAIRNNRYKLVIDGERRDPGMELFDLIADPGEQQNIISQYPEVAKSLEQQLYAWQESVLESLTGKDY